MTEVQRDESPTDTELIDRCGGGDERAWRALVARYERLVYSIARQCGLDSASSDDVFQEVFTALHRDLARLRRPSGLCKWLITTSTRIARRTRGKQVGAPTIAADVLAETVADDGRRDGPSGEADAVRWEDRQLVYEGLQRLGGRCEELLLALYADPEGPRYEDVAIRVGIPVGSIGPTRARCLRKLLEILAGAEDSA